MSKTLSSIGMALNHARWLYYFYHENNLYKKFSLNTKTVGRWVKDEEKIKKSTKASKRVSFTRQCQFPEMEEELYCEYKQLRRQGLKIKATGSRNELSCFWRKWPLIPISSSLTLGLMVLSLEIESPYDVLLVLYYSLNEIFWDVVAFKKASFWRQCVVNYLVDCCMIFFNFKINPSVAKNLYTHGTSRPLPYFLLRVTSQDTLSPRLMKCPKYLWVLSRHVSNNYSICFEQSHGVSIV